MQISASNGARERQLRRRGTWRWPLACIGTALWLSGCALPTAQEHAASTTEQASETAEREPASAQSDLGQTAVRLLLTPSTEPAWTAFPLPGKTYAPFEAVRQGGEDALRVRAKSSVSILRQRIRPALPAVGSLSFRWKTDALPPAANVAEASRDDSAVRVVLGFDGDRSLLPAREHRLSEMSRLLTGEELPYATLMYVWSPVHPAGTVLTNARSTRIRKLVVDSGTQHLGQWREHRRDVRADFQLAFGEEPGPLMTVGLMTDTDNTRSQTQAWYGRLRLLPAPP